MRVLHVAWGFKPFRSGGLIEYAEDLMETQLEKGYDVRYFCAGRYDVFVRGPKLKRWKSPKGYPVYEIINPPILNGEDLGTKTLLIEIKEPITEAFFIEVLQEVKPTVVHFHEFQGLPSSLVSICSDYGIRTIFTTHDFFLLCPTAKLLNPNGSVCTSMGDELAQGCANCSARAHQPGFKIQAKLSLRTYLSRKQLSLMKKLFALAGRKKWEDQVAAAEMPPCADYMLRRQENIRQLEKVDVILANSSRAAELYRRYSSFKNLRLLHITLRHIHEMRPLVLEVSDAQKPVVTFGLINVMSTAMKGRDLMLEVFRLLQGSAQTGAARFEFVVLGPLDDPGILRPYPFVRYVGPYKLNQLDHILRKEKIRVGIVPSICEEPYGLVGIEFLGKGIPVIGNKMGGITDYVIDGETGWVNKLNNAAGMVAIIQDIVAHPSKVNSLNLGLIANRPKYIKSMDHHFQEIDAVYRTLPLPV